MKHIFVMFILSIAISPGRAHGQASSDSTLQALLAEVRQLRMALERSAVVAPKIQVILQRMQLQQDSVSRTSRQLEDLRDQLAKSAAEEANTAAHIKDIEARATQEQDATRRKQLEDEVRAIKPRLEKTDQQRINDAQQRARESELAGRLQTEQGKLNELNDRLNTLERMLEQPPQPKQP